MTARRNQAHDDCAWVHARGTAWAIAVLLLIVFLSALVDAPLAPR